MSVRYLPPEVDRDDRPQGLRRNLATYDILASPADGLVMEERSMQFMMRFLVNHFDNLAPLKSFAPKESSPLPVSKSIAVPMKILENDAKYIHETIQILEKLVTDAALSGRPEVM